MILKSKEYALINAYLDKRLDSESYSQIESLIENDERIRDEVLDIKSKRKEIALCIPYWTPDKENEDSYLRELYAVHREVLNLPRPHFFQRFKRKVLNPLLAIFNF